MSISEHVAIEKRFTALESEVAKLRQELSELKSRPKKSEAKNES